MRISSVVCLSFVLVSGPALAQSKGPPALVAKALSLRTEPTQYAYDFSITETGTRKMQIEGRIDPSKPAGQRVEITKVEGEDVDIEELDERMEDGEDGDIWCDSMLAHVEGPFTEQAGNRGLRKYAFTPKGSPDAEKQERDLFKRLDATAHINEANGQLDSFNAVLTKSWKPNIMAKINTFEMSGTCALAPNGRAYTKEVSTNIIGSALSQSFSSSSTYAISNLKPVN